MQYGAYKTVRELVSGSTATIFLAVDAAGDAAKSRFAVKLCTAGAGFDSEWQSEKDREAASQRVWDFLASTTRQKRTHAAGARHVAAIYDGGTCDQGPWFATDYYPRTAQKLIEGHVTFTREALHHIIHSVVLGALEYKAHTGDSHGNIKPSNVLLGSQRRLDLASVVLCDPFASKTEHVSNLDAADLHAIGELLYQFVRRRGDVSGAEHWPIETSNDWTTVFGDASPQWLTLCNQLLDPNLWQTPLNLEALEQQLAQLRPKEGVPWLKMAAVIVALGVVGVGAWWGWRQLDGGRQEKRSKALQTAVADAENAFQTKDYAAFRVALAKASALIPSTPAGKERTAADIQKLSDLMAKLEVQFQTSVAAAQNALSSKRYAEVETEANQALALKPGDQAAKKIVEQAQAQLAAMGQAERQFQALVKAAQDSFNNKQYAEAEKKANQALGLKPGDPEATKILNQAQVQSAVMLKLESDYKAAVAAAQDALSSKQYAEAETKANQALALKPGDQAAKKIVEQAQAQLAAMGQAERQFQALLKAAQDSFNNRQYAEAEKKANQALSLKPIDPVATKILNQAQAQLAVMQKLENDYKAAVTAAQSALDKQDYTLAEKKADEALLAKAGDTKAQQIRTQAQQGSALMKKRETEYQAAVTAAQSALDKQDYTLAEKKADEALLAKAGDTKAQQIRTQAQQGSALMKKRETEYQAAVTAAQSALDKQDYTLAEKKADEALLAKAGDTKAQQIRTQAQQGSALMKKRETEYQAAVTAAQSALDKQDYTLAEKKADEALLAKAGDTKAQQIRTQAQQGSALMKKRETEYQAAVTAAQSALDKQDYTLAEKKADEALLAKAGDTKAQQIRTQAQQGSAALLKLEADYKAAVAAYRSATNDGRFALAMYRADEASRLKQSPEAASVRDYSSIGIKRLMETSNWPGMKQAMRDLPVDTKRKAPFDAYWQWLADNDPEAKLRNELSDIDRSLAKLAVRLNRKEQLKTLGLTEAQTGEKYDPTVVIAENEVLYLKARLDAWFKKAQPIVPDVETLKRKRDGIYQVPYGAWKIL